MLKDTPHADIVRNGKTIKGHKRVMESFQENSTLSQKTPEYFSY